MSPFPLFIKICGLTTAEAVHAAAMAGADAIGFVFAPSTRRVTPVAAARLAEDLRPGILRIAVTQHPDQSLIDEIFATLAPDCLQTDVEDFDALTIPAHAARLPVLRANRERPARLPSRFLFEGPASGAGRVSDWEEAARLAKRAELVLAGGLNATNVASAIARVRPYGIDVSTGVEAKPGLKDPNKIESFVRAARTAARGESL
ncbi:MAG TPA: phosphoribosylanthranilate isomerase [Steroidobacteraceae bacterium]|nr:phosphoribosylanthranilate isomerase [Steroidobacteraceae bacterium]